MSILATEYEKVVELSERVAWKLNEVFPPGVVLDFNRSFMPSAMFLGRELTFLSDKERLKLNQIFGNAYRYLFYFVEAYIIDMAMRHAESELYGDDDNLRAMLRFADEEVKHQKMFQRLGQMFESSFGSPCGLVESPQAVATFILSKSPLAVMLTTLHLELVTQAHYVDCMRDSDELDPLFRSLFRFHWLEESQHAKIDVLEITKLRRYAAPGQVQQAIDEYFEIAGAFSDLLAQQAALDVSSLEIAVGRTYAEQDRRAIVEAQRRSYNRTFLGSGLTNTTFLEFLAEYFPQSLAPAAKAAVVYG